ncbi:hypothetical protein DRO29_01645 [Candidatus Bathyarchaeota archaeon]|nr:MAG: hypothetical protein DRO29_01645 [Candidatus Bathyarchaeota archaeon]
MIWPNNSRGKETKTASEERKKLEIKPFHGRYRGRGSASIYRRPRRQRFSLRYFLNFLRLAHSSHRARQP